MQMKLQGYKKNYSNVILMIVLTHTIVNIIWRRPLNELRFPVASTSINTEAGSVDIPGTTMKALNDRPWKVEGDFNNDTTVLSEMRQAHRSCNETTIVLTTNFIPTSPSLAIINRTIHSIRRLKGLCPTAPLIISVDGLNKEARRIHNNSEPRLEEYVKRLRTVYNETHQRVVASNHSLMITGTVYQAMDLVKTEFVYVIQHDMPFIQDIDHTALVRTYDQFPVVLRLVRFNLRPNIQRGDLEGNNTCYAEETPVNDVNGISLIKTWIWSDNNHFTRKSYYDEMKELFYKRHGRLPFAMEWVMRVEGQKNCSYWGTFYYGPQGQAPTIAHMDGRQTTQVAENEDLRLRRWMR